MKAVKYMTRDDLMAAVQADPQSSITITDTFALDPEHKFPVYIAYKRHNHPLMGLHVGVMLGPEGPFAFMNLSRETYNALNSEELPDEVLEGAPYFIADTANTDEH